MRHQNLIQYRFEIIFSNGRPIAISTILTIFLALLLAALSACSGPTPTPTGNCPAVSGNYWRECNDGETANNFLDGRFDTKVTAVAPGRVSWAPGQSVSGYFHVSDAIIDYKPGPAPDQKAVVKYGFWGDGQSNVVIDNNSSSYFSVSTITATNFVHGNKLYSFDITCHAAGSGGYLMLTFNYYGPRLRSYIGSVTCAPAAG